MLGALLAVGFLALTDYLTGSELSFSIFYLLPITFATLIGGLRSGLLISLASLSGWMAADIAGGHVYEHWLIPYWNGSVRLGYFTLHTYLLTRLLDANRAMRELALRDPLTGAANLRFFSELARRALEDARRFRRPLTVAYADLDDFKAINDTMGHDVGDEVLRITVETIQSQIRPTDILARVGGDEFVLLLPDTNYENGAKLLSRFRETLIQEFRSNEWPLSLSLGAVTFRRMPASVEILLKKADDLMYEVKNSGKGDVRHGSWPVQ